MLDLDLPAGQSLRFNLPLEQAPLPERRRQHERLSHGRAEDGAAVNQLFQLH